MDLENLDLNEFMRQEEATPTPLPPKGEEVFRAGDRVVITQGVYRGARGKIFRIGSGCNNSCLVRCPIIWVELLDGQLGDFIMDDAAGNPHPVVLTSMKDLIHID